MKTIDVEAKVHLILELDDNVDPEECVEELDYNFCPSRDKGVSVRFIEITDRKWQNFNNEIITARQAEIEQSNLANKFIEEYKKKHPDMNYLSDSENSKQWSNISEY